MNNLFEMRTADFSKPLFVPYISGCFMVFRTELFKKVGLFDEHYFLHLEDTDISRRFALVGDNVMIPTATVYHKWERETHKSIKMKRITIKSALYYFFKFGWFFDQDRNLLNNKAIKENNL